MLAKHPLLRNAHSFPLARSLDMPDWLYRRDWGAWVESARPDSLMVAPRAAKPGEPPKPPPKPVPTSKKADQETGEDLKGA